MKVTIQECQSKRCTKCGIVKNKNDFYNDGKYKSSCCKKCKDSYSKSRAFLIYKQAASRRKNPLYRGEILKYYMERRIKKRPNMLLQNAKYRAAKNNIKFNIDISDIEIPEYCPLLGIKINLNSGRQCDNSPSLDRIIPELGYIKGNVKVISQKANRIKNNATKEDLLVFMKNITDYFAS